ncbi:MAG: hypothetical protein HY202_07270 [Nitrospirae bacterium]|nr:hypothetical protein [Nitrospirota bacterium]
MRWTSIRSGHHHNTPLKTVFPLLFLFLFLPDENRLYAAGFNRAADPLPIKYDIHASLETPGNGSPIIQGRLDVSFTNPSSEPLAEVPFMLYPNRYLTPPASLPDAIFKRSFPKPFLPGQMEISQAFDSDKRRLDIRCPDAGLGKNVICRVVLKEPLSPGQFTTLTLDFTTIIPERLGAFGYFKSVITLEGGWHPYLPDFAENAWQVKRAPPRADFSVDIRYPVEYELNHSGDLMTKTLFNDYKFSNFVSKESEFISLIFSTRYTDMIAVSSSHIIYYSYFKKDKSYAKKVVKTADQALEFFEKEYGPAKITILRLAEAFLYEDLYSEGEGIVLVSHVTYKILPPLKTYHEARLLHGIYAHLWRSQIPWAEDWVIEMLSDFTSQAFLFKKLHHSLEGVDRFLKPFAFIPIVDEILYTPNPAFREVFLQEGKPFPFRERVRLYNTPRIEGAGILFKLQNLLGREKALEIIEDYLKRVQNNEHPAFIELSESLAHQDLGWFYRQWLNTYPEPDYGIESVQDDFTGSIHQTTVSIRQKGEGVEPLTVRATLTNNSLIDTTRQAGEPDETFTFKSPYPAKVIELDPNRLTNDPDRFNNREPHQWKFLLDKVSGAFDLQTHTPHLEFGGSFKRMYDNNNTFSLYYYRVEDTRGFRGDFHHYFPNTDGEHGITQNAGGNFKGETVSIPGQEDETRGSMGLSYQIGYLAYSMTFEYNQQFTGPEHPFNGRVFFDALNEVRRWSPYHALLFKTRLAESSGPLSSPFPAGAGSGLRGYTATALSGSTMSVFSLDYVFPLYYDLDQNLFGLSLFHTLQGELFLDTGNASEERNLFLFHQYKSDFGGGVNLEFDLFGAYPTSMAVKLAYPINALIPGERMIHYYLDFGIHF